MADAIIGTSDEVLAAKAPNLTREQIHEGLVRTATSSSAGGSGTVDAAFRKASAAHKANPRALIRRIVRDPCKMPEHAGQPAHPVHPGDQL